jgi:hypothetical protein
MQKTLLAAVSATTTSDPINVEGLKEITVHLLAAGISSGNGAFTFDASNDGKTWVTGIGILDAKATARTTFVVSLSVTADATPQMALIPSGYKMIRVKVTRTTDGNYSAFLQAEKR